jgi:hypothetical protein
MRQETIEGLQVMTANNHYLPIYFTVLHCCFNKVGIRDALSGVAVSVENQTI